MENLFAKKCEKMNKLYIYKKLKENHISELRARNDQLQN